MWPTSMPDSSAPSFSFATARIAFGVSPAHEKPQRERHQDDDGKRDDAWHGEKGSADFDHIEGVRQVDGAGIGAEGDEQCVLDDNREPERYQENVAIVAVTGQADDKALQGVAEPEKQHRQRHRREVRIEAEQLIGKERSEHGRGQQRAVREVDDVQHAVDQRQPKRDQGIHRPGHQSVEHRRNEDGR